MSWCTRGAVVIDNSPAFRLREGMPLIVPEINAHELRDGQRLLPVANCTAIILCMALAPVRNCAGLRNVVVSTYQAVSGAGRAAVEQFEAGEGEFAGNIVPQIGAIGADGASDEERKVAQETRKILRLSPFDNGLRPAQGDMAQADKEFPIAVTAVRVPVRSVHCESVYFETQRQTSVDELAAAFEGFEGVVFHRDGVVTSSDAQGTDDVHVSRLRAHGERAFQMWIAGDQLRKGAATTAVQLLELAIANTTLTLRPSTRRSAAAQGDIAQGDTMLTQPSTGQGDNGPSTRASRGSG